MRAELFLSANKGHLAFLYKNNYNNKAGFKLNDFKHKHFNIIQGGNKMGKLSRLVTVAAVAAATGAGVYYYLNKSQIEAAKAEGEEGVSGTGTTAQDSVSDFFREKKDAIMNSREYVALSQNVSTAKDALVKTVKEAAEKVKEKASEAKDGVGVVDGEAKEKAEEFEFEQFAEEVKEATEA